MQERTHQLLKCEETLAKAHEAKREAQRQTALAQEKLKRTEGAVEQAHYDAQQEAEKHKIGCVGFEKSLRTVQMDLVAARALHVKFRKLTKGLCVELERVAEDLSAALNEEEAEEIENKKWLAWMRARAKEQIVMRRLCSGSSELRNPTCIRRRKRQRIC